MKLLFSITTIIFWSIVVTENAAMRNTRTKLADYLWKVESTLFLKTGARNHDHKPFAKTTTEMQFSDDKKPFQIQTGAIDLHIIPQLQLRPEMQAEVTSLHRTQVCHYLMYIYINIFLIY